MSRTFWWRGGWTVWPQAKQQGEITAPPINRKSDWRFTEHGPAHQNKSFPVSPSVSLSHKPLILLHQRADRLKTTITENHNHRKLTNLITWTTALSNSVKLWAMLDRATQNGQIMVESSDKTWSTGEGNGKLLQCSCLQNNMKRQKDSTLKDGTLQIGRCPIYYWRSLEK